MSIRDNAFISSGKVSTAGSQVTAVGTPTIVNSVVVNPAAATSTVNLHNGGSGGTILWTLSNNSSQLFANTQDFGEPGLLFSNGLYVEVTGTSATACVAYHLLLN